LTYVVEKAMNMPMARPARARDDTLPPRLGSRAATWILACSGVLAAFGCSRDGGVADSELGELVLAPRSPDQAIDLAAAARDPREFGRAAMMSHRRLAVLLGPHRAAIKSSLEVKEVASGKIVEQSNDETTLEFASDSAWHGVMNNSADYGRDVLFHDGALFLRARYQRWHKRAPSNDAEPIALRDHFYEPIAAHWDLLAPATAISDGGEATFAGQQARKITLSTAAPPRSPAAEPLTHRKWRQSRTLEGVAGEAVLDAGSGALLQLSLRGTVGFHRDGVAYSMRIEVSSAVSNVGQTPVITEPAAEEVVLTPGRMHEVDDRDKLLEGIAPPLRGAEKTKPAVRPSSTSDPSVPAVPGSPR
jgi:hypothetical protein